MSINEISSDLIRSLIGRAVREARQGGEPAPAREARGLERADRVEISDEARALAAQHEAGAGGVGDLSPERLAVIRQRIREGVYDSPEIVERVARRLLERGDV